MEHQQPYSRELRDFRSRCGDHGSEDSREHVQGRDGQDVGGISAGRHGERECGQATASGRVVVMQVADRGERRILPCILRAYKVYQQSIWAPCSVVGFLCGATSASVPIS